MGYEIPLFKWTLLAAEDYRNTGNPPLIANGQYRFIDVNQNGHAEVLSVQGARAVGVLQNNPDDREEAELNSWGISKLVYGNTLISGQTVMSDNQGRGIPFILAAGNTGVAICLEGGNVNEVGTVLLIPSGNIARLFAGFGPGPAPAPVPIQLNFNPFDPAGVNFPVVWGNASAIVSVTDITSDYELTEDVHFTVVEDTLIISDEYLGGLDPGTYEFEVVFNTGETAIVIVEVLYIGGEITFTAGNTFDHETTAQATIIGDIEWNHSSAISTIINTTVTAGGTLEEGATADYTIASAALTLRVAYLETLPAGTAGGTVEYDFTATFLSAHGDPVIFPFVIEVEDNT